LDIFPDFPGRTMDYTTKIYFTKRLAEDDRRTLAMFFGIDERRLGAIDPWSPFAG